MNKIVKGFIIAACICIALGFVFFVGAAASGGISGARSILENGGVIGISLGSDDFKEWNSASEHTISLVGMNKPNLELELGAGEFEIRESETEDIVVKSKKKIEVSSYGDTISVRTKKHYVFFGFIGNNHNEVTIEVPRGTKFNEIDMEVGAGELNCPSIAAEKLNIELGAGRITIDDYTCNEANIYVGAGEVIAGKGTVVNMDAEVGMVSLTFAGSIAQNLNVDCGMGNVQMDLKGSEEDYNYRIECGMGNVTVGSSSYGGVACEKNIDNGSAYDFDLDCGMGNVEIMFSN